MDARIQVNPTDTINVRDRGDGEWEIVILDPRSECSAVIRLAPAQLRRIAELAPAAPTPTD